MYMWLWAETSSEDKSVGSPDEFAFELGFAELRKAYRYTGEAVRGVWAEPSSREQVRVTTRLAAGCGERLQLA